MVEQLSADELATLEMLLTKVDRHAGRNRQKLAYYEAKQEVQQLGIAIPPKILSRVTTAAGWAGTVVDVLEERLDWQGWTDTNDAYGLSDVYADNSLDVESGLAHLDALIFGTSFIAVGTGDVGEPDTLVTVESPLNMTGDYDPRTRRLRTALSRGIDPQTCQVTNATLYLPDQTIYLSRDNEGLPWNVDRRDQHNLGRIPVVQLVNRPRASDPLGRSEITRAVRSYTDMAVRTLLGMEVNREFYSAPQRWAMQVGPDQFKKADGTVVTGWEAIMGRMLAVPFDDENPEATPTVGQFPQSQPGPYLEQVRGLSEMVASEAGIPVSYFGFSTDNPPSADAIRAMEARLVKRAERRQTTFGKGWMEVGRLVVLMREQEIPTDFNRTVSLNWQDAATPTRSATADETAKYVAAGILPPDSSVTYRRMGLSLAEQAQLEQDKRKARLQEVLAARTSPTPQPGQNPPQNGTQAPTTPPNAA